MSTYGTLFRVTTFGESHCASVGAIIDGCPPGLELSADDIQVQLNRRRPGQSDLTTPRNEKDAVQLQSGLERGVTLGTPIALLVRNEDQRPHDYSETDLFPRPSHADYTYLEKYGVKASSGGGRSSARETIGRVAAGAIAEKYLRIAHGVEIVAFVSSVGKVHLPTTAVAVDADGDDDDAPEPLSPDFRALLANVSREEVDKQLTRCPHPETAERMKQRIMRAKSASDSIGGTVTCIVRRLPPGLGEPVFDKLEALLAHAMLSIPATKGFEIGSGFRGTEVSGSAHNDAFVRRRDGSLGTATNWSGGIQGGISNGEDVYFRVAFKPPATISQAQTTVQYDGTPGTLAARGRHDPCVVPRAVPIVEAMAAIVLMDALLMQKARQAAASLLPPITTLPPTMVLPPKVNVVARRVNGDDVDV
ncbi:chorismate synthase [Mycena pura]|uniref:Chorismate synthase n=1 Tax=Mycena pura TaxID=153505 RepID=A0AAD7E3A8_9AGAR|nr:chorismate synthase [Mycena pura]